MNRIVKQRGLPGTWSPEPEAYESQHAWLARKAAAEGFVLLKNEAHILPLKPGCSVALYGAGASKTVKGGTGSGDVNERYSVSIFEGLKRAGLSVTTEAWITAYERCYDQARAAWKQSILDKLHGSMRELDFFSAYSTTPFFTPVGDAVSPTETDTAIYVLSRVAGEGADRFAAPGDYFLRPEEHQMLADICAIYPRVILLVNTGGVVDLSFLDEFPQIQALLVISQPGMEGGNAVADVLLGKVNHSGKRTPGLTAMRTTPTPLHSPTTTATSSKSGMKRESMWATAILTPSVSLCATASARVSPIPPSPGRQPHPRSAPTVP